MKHICCENVRELQSEISLHPRSPREADPDHVRTKRQAYQVYVGGDVSITVDQSGQPESGVWGHWNGNHDCSRTCGGGVQIEKRQCKYVDFVLVS